MTTTTRKFWVNHRRCGEVHGEKILKVINGGSANLAFFDRHRLTAKKSLEFSNKFIETALKVASNFATEAYVRFCSKPQLIGMTVRGRPTKQLL